MATEETEAANQAFFEHWDPLLLREIMGCEALGQLDQGPNGPGLRILELCFHDPLDPRAEAQRVLGSSPQGLHIHFGFGLGYFLEADQPAASGMTLIFEPNPAFVKLALQQHPLEAIFRRTRATLCSSFARFRYLFYKHHARYTSNRLFISRSHARYFTQDFSAFEKLIDGQSSEFVVKTANRLYPTVIRSTIESLADHGKSPGYELWRGHLKGKPAVIIAAGPSLDKNLVDLLPHRHKLVIFAVSRVVAVLEKYGIAPDFLVHVEAQDFRTFIEGRSNLTNTIFLLAGQAHPYYYRFPHRQTFVYQSRTNPLINSLVARYPQMRHELIRTGGSVATAAFYLAFLAGCDPIVLLGQDLALSGKICYAGGESHDKSGEMRRKVPAFFGGKIETLANYHNNIIWYEKGLPVLKKMDPSRSIINATEGGARLAGMDRRQLAHVLHDLTNGKLDVVPPDTQSCYQLQESQVRQFFRELADFLSELLPLKANFANIESQLLAHLSSSGTTGECDPMPLVTNLRASLGKSAHFSELCKGEFAMTKFLDRKLSRYAEQVPSDEEMTRIWASLAAIHHGLSDLDLLRNGLRQAFEI